MKTSEVVVVNFVVVVDVTVVDIIVFVVVVDVTVVVVSVCVDVVVGVTLLCSRAISNELPNDPFDLWCWKCSHDISLSYVDCSCNQLSRCFLACKGPVL
jgi:Zn finger protein HypA/HybF involved in hydrogenase expression